MLKTMVIIIAPHRGQRRAPPTSALRGGDTPVSPPLDFGSLGRPCWSNCGGCSPPKGGVLRTVWLQAVNQSHRQADGGRSQPGGSTSTSDRTERTWACGRGLLLGFWRLRSMASSHCLTFACSRVAYVPPMSLWTVPVPLRAPAVLISRCYHAINTLVSRSSPHPHGMLPPSHEYSAAVDAISRSLWRCSALHTPPLTPPP